MEEFDYKVLTENLIKQAKGFLENDDTFFETEVEYILSVIEKYSLMAGEAAQIDNNFNMEQKAFITQVIAEWIYHKTRDVVQASIPEDYHENIFQKIAYVIYQTVTDGWKNGIETQIIMSNVGDNVVETYKNILRELLNRKFITEDCYEFALSLSSIDEFSGTECMNKVSWKEKYEELNKKYNNAIELIKTLLTRIEQEKIQDLNIKYDEFFNQEINNNER